ncbi:MAG: PAS domain S-box protein, partial [Planctomycetota bacterium]
MKTKYRYIALSALPPLVFWLLDGVLDYLIFYEGSMWELMVSNIPPHELYIRSMVGAFLAAGGAAFAFMYTRTRESAEKYCNFFRTCRDAAFITTRNGEWVEVNDALVDLFGYDSRAELTALPVHQVYEDPAQREEYLQLIASKGCVKDHPLRLRRKDGSIMEALVTSVPVTNDEGEMTGLQGTIRDVTERREMERRLRRSERKYRSIFELSPEAIVLLDSQARIVDVNGRLKDWLGYDPEEVRGKSLSELPYLTRKGKEKTLEFFRRRMSGEDLGPYELEFIDRSGGRRIGEVRATRLEEDTGTEAANLVMISDITERKRAEKEKRRSERRLRNMVENIPGVAYRCRSEPGRPMEMWGAGGTELTGYGAEEFAPSGDVSYEDLIHTDDRDRVRHGLHQAI